MCIADNMGRTMERTRYHFALVLVLLLLFLIMSCHAKKTPNITTDQSALLAFKAYISSDPHEFLLNNWSVGSSVCDWIGVKCGSPRHHRVTALNISHMGLTGTIPPHLGNLSFLVYLNLRNNSFHGSLPQELAHLRRLKVLEFRQNFILDEVPKWLGSLHHLRFLSFANNNFSGLIPTSLSNLSQLETLYLSSNSLQGIIPAEIGNLHSLKELIIEANQLSGSLPSQIFNISTLESISLQWNLFSGDIPNQICRHLPRLEQLGLAYNQFRGKIPLNLTQCSNLRYLGLSYNNFSEAFIPKEIGNLKMLELLYASNNKLKGKIPKEIGNLTMLRELSLSNNNLTGDIPEVFGKLDKLEELYLYFNNLGGQMPMEVFNLSPIRVINLGANFLSGRLPSGMGYALPNLEKLSLYTNHLRGVIPQSISNSSRLILIELSENNFTGSIPDSLGHLEHLQVLTLFDNKFTSKSSSRVLDLFTFLSKCKDLRSIAVTDNPLDGILPTSIGNLSKSIERIYANNCKIKGSIPKGIGNLSSLVILSLSRNQFTGSIPSTFGALTVLQGLHFGFNKLSGTIPEALCSLQRLSELYLHENHISGSIPDCFGNVTSLRYLYISSNKLTSSIPTNLWNLKDLLLLNLSLNSLSGSLSLEVGDLKGVSTMDLSSNYLVGGFPSTFGNLENLVYLSLSQNRLQGSIPESIGKMMSVEYLDLSHNNLSGSIPKSMENLQFLKYFNVSFNKLVGEVPSKGPFENFTSGSFIVNEGLCAAPSRFNLPPCPDKSAHKRWTKKIRLVVFLVLGIASILSVIGLGVGYLRRRNKDKAPNGNEPWSITTQERISYYQLLHATNGYDKSNLLGEGSIGTVYKATLDDGRVLAVKVFNLQMERGFESFEAECQVLRNTRHRNLTKVIGNCSNPDFKALVLEFMPNGSLEKWLYSNNYFLDIMQRLDIVIDVASALQYLHFGNSTQIIHCDVKPNNVLFDQDMVAHLSDFGISKLLDRDHTNAYTETLATFGYMAPEYGLEGLISTKCDVYSYGILLIEVFTRRRPNDEMFSEGLSLREWVNNSIPRAFAQVIDVSLVNEVEECYTEKLKCLLSIIEVALKCTMESPRERCSMEDVLANLGKIKFHLLSYHKPTLP